MSGRCRTMRALIRGATLGVALIASLVVAHGGFARSQAAGGLVRAEAQLAVLLAMGGTIGDLCEDVDLHCLGCGACDICCLQVGAAIPPAEALAGPWRHEVAGQAVRPGHVDAVLPRALPGPRVRAPPIRT